MISSWVGTVHRSLRGESLNSRWRAFNACSEQNRHERAALLAYTLRVSVILTARAPIAVVGYQRSVDAMTQSSLAQHRERKMDTTTMLVIIVAVLLLGGGGFFYRRRA